MKTDARVRYTKKVIQEHFTKLLSKKTLDKITVKSICDAAEINRTTFYKYYTDVYDLMQQIEDETLIGLHELMEVTNSKNIEDILEVVLGAILKQKEYFMLLFYKQDIHSFNEKLILLCYQTKQLEISNSLSSASVREQEWFYYFLAQGSSSILDCWVQGGMKDDPCMVSRFISERYYQLLGR